MPTLTKFDPSRPLKVAGKFIRLHAVVYQKGDALPYSPEDHRIIERLYMQRKVTYGDGQEVQKTTPTQRLHAGGAQRRQQERDAKDNAEKVLTPKPEAPAPPTEDEAAAVKKLVNANNHEALFKAASGLAGVHKKMPKGEIALALVRAGREPS